MYRDLHEFYPGSRIEFFDTKEQFDEYERRSKDGVVDGWYLEHLEYSHSRLHDRMIGIAVFRKVLTAQVAA
jgi:hypothetical protein